MLYPDNRHGLMTWYTVETPTAAEGEHILTFLPSHWPQTLCHFLLGPQMRNRGFVTLNYSFNHYSTLTPIALLRCTFYPLEFQYWRGHIIINKQILDTFILDHLRRYITGPPSCYWLVAMKSNMHISEDCMNSTLLFYSFVYTAQLSKCETSWDC